MEISQKTEWILTKKQVEALVNPDTCRDPLISPLYCIAVRKNGNVVTKKDGCYHLNGSFLSSYFVLYIDLELVLKKY